MREKQIGTQTELMLALINPVVLPALRIAATFFCLMYLLFGAYIFRNRHRFFGSDPSVDNDIPAVRKVRIEVVMIPWLGVTTLILVIPAVRKVRIEVVMIPWLGVTTLILVLLISFWLA